jgi:hypothetical protein
MTGFMGGLRDTDVKIDTCELQVHPISPTAAEAAYHEHNETAQYTIDITYPLNYPDRVALSDFVSADRAQFLDWVNRFGSDRRNRPYTYHVTAKTFQSAQPATTSIVLTIDNDTGYAHEGHPSTAFKSLNYDLTKQAPVTFDTLFTSGAAVVDVLTPLVRTSYDAPGLELSPSDCQNFAVTDDAVIFFFGEGQLIPADNTGPRQISVPRSELAPLIA